MKYSLLLYGLFIKQVFGIDDPSLGYETMGVAAPNGYELREGGCIHGSNMELIGDTTVEECAVNCSDNDLCMAFEFFRDQVSVGSAIAGHIMASGDCYLQSTANFESCNGEPYNIDLYLKNAPVTPDASARTNGAFGDPHFKTWNGEQFDFHGVCDLVLTSNPQFGNGVGLDVQIRTKKTRKWSFVDSAAVRIGDDILEVRGGKKGAFWINGIQGDINTDQLVITDYQITYQNISEKSDKFVVNLGDGEGIIFKTWNSFVSVNIDNPKHDNFVGSVGLMGSFPEGKKIGRGINIVEDDNMFGLEWQVLSSEHNLFHIIEGPQHPQKCEIPSSVEMRRRLAASLVTLEEAEKVCIGVNSEDKELCIFDVMATNDLSFAGAY